MARFPFECGHCLKTGALGTCNCVPPCFVESDLKDGSAVLKWSDEHVPDGHLDKRMSRAESLHLCKSTLFCPHDAWYQWERRPQQTISECTVCLQKAEGCLFAGICLSSCLAALEELNLQEKASVLQSMEPEKAAAVLVQFPCQRRVADILVTMREESQRFVDLLLAFACGFHERLGESSYIKQLGNVRGHNDGTFIDVPLFLSIASHLLKCEDGENVLARMMMLPAFDEDVMSRLARKMSRDAFKDLDKRCKKKKKR